MRVLKQRKKKQLLIPDVCHGDYSIGISQWWSKFMLVADESGHKESFDDIYTTRQKLVMYFQLAWLSN